MLQTSKKTAKRLLSVLCSVSLLSTLLPAAGAADSPSGRAGEFSLNYAPIRDDGKSGKLWIGDIGETVFDEITYVKGNEERSSRVTLDPGTGVLTADEGYTLATSGRPAQAVTFSVNAKYYDASDVLFVENFEGAQENDAGTGQKFQGTYGKNASGDFKKDEPFAMPVVIDPTKARAGQKSITQGARGAQAENVIAAYSGDLDADAWATMWYYDDGENLTGSGQFAFMGGVITKGWTTGAFNGAVGTSDQTAGGNPSGKYAEYTYRSNGGKWASTGVPRAKGWHKFQWKIGQNGTTFYVDGHQLSNTSPASWTNFGGFYFVCNWNNTNVPFRNMHFIDSFSIVKAKADGSAVDASQTFTKDITVYVVSEEDVLSLGYTKTDRTSGTLQLNNVDGIGATLVSKRFSAVDDITDKLTLDASSGAITAQSGYILSDKSNPLAEKATFAVDAEYHFGDASATETFHATIDVYYDIDESSTPDAPLTGTGARKVISLNGTWSFGGKGEEDASAVDYNDTSWPKVTVPHDWNATTGYHGNSRLNGTYWYRRSLTLTQAEADEYNKRSAFLEFDSVGMEAHVYLNGTEVGSHKGGWSAFKIDVTGRLRAGDNIIAVSANNERVLNGDIAPLHGDFDNASGINREVRLVMTSQVHLDELDHGSNGVYIIPKRASDWTDSNRKWEVDVTALVRNDTQKSRDVTVTAEVRHPTSFDDVLGLGAKGLLRFDPADMYDRSGSVIGTQTTTLSAVRRSATEAKLTVAVSDPKLWDGLESPYQYVAKISVYEGSGTNGALLDSYETMIGFRYYDAQLSAKYGTAGDGFYLNGRFYPLRGMAMHEDWPGLGRALEDKYIEKDVAVLYEMGANWTRVSHYPHDEYCYDLLSRYGIACSAEIPLVDGVSLVNRDGSYTSSKTSGIISPGFKQTTLDLFDDMVKQLYNYPAILGWLMQNELGGGTYGQGTGADATAAQAEMITALNNRSHLLDPGRKTVMAMSLSNCYNFESDWLLWNGYPGWYGSETTGIGYFVDGYANSTDTKRKRPTGVSEYGAGSNPNHQTDYIRGETSFTDWNGTGRAFHPESYANDRHEQSLREINARPFYWATGGWIMFDFSASSRNEGGRQGTNDKGLVYKARPEEIPDYSGDPEELLVRKDVFYLYKANWDKIHPLTYIAERRYENRERQDITVTVYSNANRVKLIHNGAEIGTKTATAVGPYVDRNTLADETASGIFKFQVNLANGGNEIVAEGYDQSGSKVSDDTVIWQFGDLEGLDIASDTFAVKNDTKAIFLTGEGDARDVDSLFRPADGTSAHSYRILTSDRRPVTQGEIQAGMLLEVTLGTAKRVYTFQQPYISAMKEITVDGRAGAEEAVDFRAETVWETDDTNAHEIEIDLGKKYVLTELKVNWANADGASAYTVETSIDGRIWNPVVDRSGNTIAVGEAQDELQSYGRYVKLCIAEGSIPSISEIEVYGWMVSVKDGEDRIFVSETERTICVPTDVAEFHTGGTLSGGMNFENIAPLIVVDGNCQAAHENDTDYSLDENHSLFNVTDTLGRKVPFRFKFFTGGNKPAGPFELSMGKPASSSSNQNSTYIPTNVTTEDDSRWNSLGTGASGLDEWVMVDLGSECTLDSILLEFPRNGVGGITSVRYYTYEVYLGSSIEDALFSDMVIDGSDNTDVNGVFEFRSEIAGKKARYVRVKVTGNSSTWQAGLNRLYVKGYEGDAEIPEAREITSIETLDPIEAETGMAAEDLGLPETILAELDDGSEIQVSVEWSCEDYAPDTAGEYVFIGTLDLSGLDGVENPENFRAELTVILRLAHEHVWSEEWSANRTHHWHACTVDGCKLEPGEMDSYEAHVYADDEAPLCEICGHDRTSDPVHEHEWSEEWDNNQTHHWHPCIAEGCSITDPSEIDSYEEHVWADSVCEICGYVYEPDAGRYKVTVIYGSASHSTAEAGDAVMITAEWRSGYSFNRWIVEEGDVQLGDAASSRTGFIMPAEDVVIRAAYSEDEETPSRRPVRPARPASSSNTVKDKDSTTYELPSSGRVTGGSYELSPARAKKGDKVLVTTKPDIGYEVGNVSVTSQDGTAVIVTPEGGQQFSFKMPDGQVQIQVDYRQISASYADVSDSDWFKSAVDYASSKGMMAGNRGQFSPYDNLTRGMIAQILYNLENNAEPLQHSFPDVSSSDWFSPAVSWVSAKGVMSGYSNGQFGANDSVTREQLALTLYQYAVHKGYDTTASAELGTFVDGADTSNWARAAMQWAVAHGLFSGKSGGRLDPQGTATRAEVASVLMNFCERIAK